MTSMSADCVLDTNILVYAVSETLADAKKREIALRLIAERAFALSAQILQEFYVTVTRKIRAPLPAEVAAGLVDQYRSFPIVPTDDALIMAAIETSLRHRISYWAAAIIAAADELEVDTLFTEDLAHDRRYGRVRVVNPFLAVQ